MLPVFEMKLSRFINVKYMLFIRPQMDKLPISIQRFDDPFFPFTRSIVDATQEAVCGYIFDLSGYLSIGAAGAVALERSIAYVQATKTLLTILHSPIWGSGFATGMSKLGFDVDGVTLLRSEDAQAYMNVGVQPLIQVSSNLANGHSSWSPSETYGVDSIWTVSATKHEFISVFSEKTLYRSRGDDFAKVTADGIWSDIEKDRSRAE